MHVCGAVAPPFGFQKPKLQLCDLCFRQGGPWDGDCIERLGSPEKGSDNSLGPHPKVPLVSSDPLSPHRPLIPWYPLPRATRVAPLASPGYPNLFLVKSRYQHEVPREYRKVQGFPWGTRRECLVPNVRLRFALFFLQIPVLPRSPWASLYPLGPSC